MRLKPVNKNNIILKVIEDYATFKTNDKGEKILKKISKNIQSYQEIPKDEIKYIRQVIATNKKPYKDRCLVNLNGEILIIKGNFNELRNEIFTRAPKHIIKGYANNTN
jgi:hypothetical protein